MSLLQCDPAFVDLPDVELRAAAHILTYVFTHTTEWRRLWGEDVPGPGTFTDTRTVRIGTSEETVRELSRTVGLEAGGSLKVLSGKVSSAWSTVTRGAVVVNTEHESTRQVSLDVPAGEPVLIERWQRYDVLMRRLQVRAGRDLPPDPVPEWVERAIRSQPVEISIPADETRLVRRASQG